MKNYLLSKTSGHRNPSYTRLLLWNNSLNKEIQNLNTDLLRIGYPENRTVERCKAQEQDGNYRSPYEL